MSQHTVYKCDQCKREIGQKAHVSLVFANQMNASGIAVPPKGGNNSWGMSNTLNGRFVHFHDGKCIGLYFDALIKKATNKKS